jgi:hypothetical protein
MKKRIIFLATLVVLVAAFLVVPTFWRANRVSGAPDVFASPIQAGCYISGPNECHIHADPFTIDIASGQKLYAFKLVAIRVDTGAQTMLYHFKTDVSNPVPFLGTTYTPSLVAQDFAATCGRTYQLSLQGRDTGDTSLFNLGMTNPFVCPSAMP